MDGVVWSRPRFETCPRLASVDALPFPLPSLFLHASSVLYLRSVVPMLRPPESSKKGEGKQAQMGEDGGKAKRSGLEFPAGSEVDQERPCAATGADRGRARGEQRGASVMGTTGTRGRMTSR